LFFFLQQWLHEHATVLHYIYSAQLVVFYVMISVAKVI